MCVHVYPLRHNTTNSSKIILHYFGLNAFDTWRSGNDRLLKSLKGK